MFTSIQDQLVEPSFVALSAELEQRREFSVKYGQVRNARIEVKS